jgi:hypothetical protein
VDDCVGSRAGRFVYPMHMTPYMTCQGCEDAPDQQSFYDSKAAAHQRDTSGRQSAHVVGGGDLVRHSRGDVAALLSRQVDRHRPRPHAGHHLLRDQQRRLLACVIGVQAVTQASKVKLAEEGRHYMCP